MMDQIRLPFVIALFLAASISANAQEEKLYTLQDVAKHAIETDCWIAIEGKIYDVTKYLEGHPSGPETITAWCGAEATIGMRTKEIGDDHSTGAWQELEQFFIGSLK